MRSPSSVAWSNAASSASFCATFWAFAASTGTSGLTPTPSQLVPVIGLIAAPFGMYATCTIANTRLQDVAKPYFRYVLVLLVTLVLLIVFPVLTIWLPRKYGLA